MDFSTEQPESRNRTIAIAAIVAVLVLAIAALGFAVYRRSLGDVPTVPPPVNGGTVPQGGQDEAPLRERPVSTGTDDPADELTPEEPPTANEVDPTTNRTLSEEEKAAAGFPVDWTVRLQAFRDQNGQLYLEYVVDQQTPDADNDRLSDAEEGRLGTDPRKADTDGDGLIDYDEVYTYLTDPKLTDSDGDGDADGQEVFFLRQDPAVADE